MAKYGSHVTSLESALKQRTAELADVSGLLSEASAVFATFEPGQRHVAHLEAMQVAIADRKFRVAVVGEFSNGKSAMINALLDHKDFLPTSLQPTTAINTFLQGVDEAHTEPCIVVHFRDDAVRPPVTHPLTSDLDITRLLKNWGTELDQHNRDERALVSRLDVFLEHPLFIEGLVVIDTPGLQSLHAHHEAIMREAIRTADTAINVMTAQRLGGNVHEWTFIKEVLMSNFSGFLTAITFWDSVLESRDGDVAALSWQERHDRSLKGVVQRTFRAQLAQTGLEASQIEELVSDRCVFPVIPPWIHEREDAEKRQWSKVTNLSNRLRDICISGEAAAQKIHTPLLRLLSTVAELQSDVARSMEGLQNPESEAQQTFAIEKIDHEIKKMEVELEHISLTARQDHDRNLKLLQTELRQTLIEPIVRLTEELDASLSIEDVRSQLGSAGQGAHRVKLPADLDHQIRTTLDAIRADSTLLAAKAAKVLDQLAESFQDDSNKLGTRVSQELKATLPDFELPSLELTVDLSNVTALLQKQQATRDTQEKLELEIEDLESRDDNDDLTRRVKKLAELESMQRSAKAEIDALGPPPMAKRKKRSTERSPILVIVWEWLFGGPEPAYEIDTTELDGYNTAKRHYTEKFENIRSETSGIEQELIRLKSDKKSTIQQIKKKERQHAAAVREAAEKQLEVANAMDALVESTYKRVSQTLRLHLEQRRRALERQVEGSLETVFDKQLQQLIQQVKAGYSERLEAERERRRRTQEAVREGEGRIAHELERLTKVKAQLDALQERASIQSSGVQARLGVPNAAARQGARR